MFLIVLLVIVVMLLSTAANWRLFQKMGYEGWKSLIPLYNQFLLFKSVFGKGTLMVVMLLMPVIAVVLAMLVLMLSAIVRIQAVGALLAILIVIAALVFMAYIAIKLMLGLARCFHRSTAFGWGLLLMPQVFTILLAFSSWAYKDGSAAVEGDDVISVVIERVYAWVCVPRRGGKDRKEPITLLKELGELHKDGLIDDAMFAAKKAELLKRI